MMPQPGKQIIIIHILANIWKWNNKQKMIFGKLIEFNMRNTFLEKLYRKCGGEPISTPISKTKFVHISGLII